MRSWVFSAGLIAPVSTKRTRPWTETGACGRAASQMASRRAVTLSTGLPPGVGCGGAVVDEPLAQGQLWEQPVPRRPAGALAWAGCRYLSCAWVLLVSRRPPGLAVCRLVHARG